MTFMIKFTYRSVPLTPLTTFKDTHNRTISLWWITSHFPLLYYETCRQLTTFEPLIIVLICSEFLYSCRNERYDAIVSLLSYQFIIFIFLVQCVHQETVLQLFCLFSHYYSNKSEAMVDAAVLEKLEAGFTKLAASDSKSLLKKHLSREVFDKLKNQKTSFGSTLLDCIQSGVENLDSGFGIYAPDAEAYTVFADIFDPMIEEYHGGFGKDAKHPPRDFGDVNSFPNLDPTGDYIVSTRVRCGRSMDGYAFNPCLTEALYKEMEEKVSATLSGLEGELKGKFYPLTGMEKSVQQQLIDDHFLFKEGDRFLQAANAWWVKLHGPIRWNALKHIYTFCLFFCIITAVSGQVDVVSITMTTKHSWSGATKKITCVSFPCKRVVT